MAVKKRWVLLLSLLLSSGCWDRREMEDLAIVSGIGIDLAEQSENYQVTFQIIRPSEVKTGGGGSGGGGGGQTKPFWSLQAKGETFFDAVRKATFQSSRRLFLSHNQVVIISEQVAKKGLLPVIDFLIRDAEPRLSEWLLITPEQAGEVLQVESKLEKISAAGIADQLHNYYLTSKIRAVNLQDFIDHLLRKTTANTLPLIRITEINGEKGLMLEKTGVFKEDKLVGYLDQRETRGLLWVLGEVQGGIIVLDLPDEGGKVSIEISRAASKVSAEVKDGQIKMKVEIKEEGLLGGQTSDQNLSAPDKIRLLETLTAQAISAEVEAALKKARQYQADIFGFGTYLHRHHRGEWEKLKNEWETYFAQLEVELKVTAMISQVGLITRPSIRLEE